MIIDENVFGCLAKAQGGGWKIVLDSLGGRRKSSKENHKWHYGGDYYRKAVSGNAFMKKLLLTLGGAARVERVNDDEVDKAELVWQAKSGLKCDTDHWALALADVSGTRLLVSDDVGLRSDFRAHLSGRTVTEVTLNQRVQLENLLRNYK
jgi:hypothetical protein